MFIGNPIGNPVLRATTDGAVSALRLGVPAPGHPAERAAVRVLPLLPDDREGQVPDHALHVGELRRGVEQSRRRDCLPGRRAGQRVGPVRGQVLHRLRKAQPGN